MSIAEPSARPGAHPQDFIDHRDDLLERGGLPMPPTGGDYPHRS
ncbi:hypothetical protein [Thiohalocapsa marina]